MGRGPGGECCGVGDAVGWEMLRELDTRRYSLTRQDAVLLQWLLPADFQGRVQDVTEAEMSHGARHCPKTPRLSTQPHTLGQEPSAPTGPPQGASVEGTPLAWGFPGLSGTLLPHPHRQHQWDRVPHFGAAPTLPGSRGWAESVPRERRASPYRPRGCAPAGGGCAGRPPAW